MKENPKQPKILIVDIETKPALAYVWRAWDENISPDQVVDPGGMLCFASKWYGEQDVDFFSCWTHSHGEMVRAIHERLSEADAVVSFNGDKFDLPKIQGEFILEGLAPTPPIVSIDAIKTVKKFGFLMNRLAFIGPLLKVGGKLKHEGFDLWAKTMAGDSKARAKMEKYNIQDVLLLEKLYAKIKPFIRNHPNLSGQASGACGSCGSTHIQSRGVRRTKYFEIQRQQCQSCGSWFDGSRRKL